MCKTVIFFITLKAAENINVQRSPGSPLSLPDWSHKGWLRHLRSYRLQNLVQKAEIFLTHSWVVWGVQDSVDFTRGRQPFHGEINFCPIPLEIKPWIH